jgi:hypothetical protein
MRVLSPSHTFDAGMEMHNLSVAIDAVRFAPGSDAFKDLQRRGGVSCARGWHDNAANTWIAYGSISYQSCACAGDECSAHDHAEVENRDSVQGQP